MDSAQEAEKIKAIQEKLKQLGGGPPADASVEGAPSAP
jgi:hypothetical protein